MLRRSFIASLLTLVVALTGGALLGGGTATAATRTAVQTETRQFTGEGSSSWGFSLDYARAQARSRANAAGFYDCTEIYMEDWFYWAEVIWECTR